MRERIKIAVKKTIMKEEIVPFWRDKTGKTELAFLKKRKSNE